MKESPFPTVVLLTALFVVVLPFFMMLAHVHPSAQAADHSSDDLKAALDEIALTAKHINIVSDANDAGLACIEEILMIRRGQGPICQLYCQKSAEAMAWEKDHAVWLSKRPKLKPIAMPDPQVCKLKKAS